MSDRSIVVRLRAEVSDYKREMAAAAKAAEEVGNKNRDSAKKSTTALGQMVRSADQHREAWTQVGTTLLGVGTAAAAGVALAVHAYADFDSEMAQVRSLSRASAADMALLTDAAKSAGTAYGYSATQVAQAQTELVKAGVSVKDILGGALDGALTLAAAGQMDVADATTIAVSAMTQFGLKASDVTHISDLLAAGADRSLASVADLGEGLKFIGPVAAQMNVSLAQTVGTLALLSQNGIQSEQAGTGLRGVLMALTSPSAIATKAMNDYGISVFNAKGEFVGMSALAGQLHDKLGGLDEATRSAALGQIFGNQQITVARVLYQGGAQAVDEWTKSVDESGFAAQQAAGKLDSLKGDTQKLGAAFQTALIDTGGAANGVLRGMVETATGAIDAYNHLSPTTQAVALGVTAVVAAVSLASGGFLVLAPRIVATRTAMTVLRKDMPVLTGAMSALGKAAAMVGTTLAIAAAAGAAMDNAAKDDVSITQYTKALLELKDATSAPSGSLLSGFADELRMLNDPSLSYRIGDVLSNVSKLWGGQTNTEFNIQRFHDLGTALASLYAQNPTLAGDRFNEVLKVTGGTTEQLLELMPAYRDAMQGTANAEEIAAGGGDALASAADNASAAVQAASEKLLKWRQAVQEADASFIDLAGAYQGVIDKNQQMAQATADATKSSKDSWQTYYDGVTVSAASYIQQLQDQVSAQDQWEQNILDLSGRVRDGMTGDMRTAAEQMIDELINLGPQGAAQVQLLRDMTDEQFAQVVDLWSRKGAEAVTQFTAAVESYRTPVVAVNADVAPAKKSVVDLLYTTGQSGAYVRIDADTAPARASLRSFITQAGTAQVGWSVLLKPGYAAGGYTGDGSPLEPAGVVHGREFVVNARATAANRGALEAMNRGLPGYGSGGYVQPRYMTAASSPSWSSAAAPVSLDGMRLTGTLDLGGGLTGLIDARVQSGLAEASRSASATRTTQARRH